MKGWLGRLLAGAGIGFLIAGPVGAIFGAVLAGGLPDSDQVFSDRGGDRGGNERLLFYSNLVVLLTLVAKADERVAPEEARAIADFYKNELNFGEPELETVRRLMKETLSVNPPPEQVAAEFARVSRLEERLALLRLLWMVAAADGRVDPREERLIARVAAALGVGAANQRATAAEFRAGGNGYYETLGLDTEASDAEVKAAYRRLAKLHHPDRVAHLGADQARLAGEKFRRINAAYDAICEERGL